MLNVHGEIAMKCSIVLLGFGAALMLAWPLATGGANAAPLVPAKVSATMVELAASKKPGRCGTYMFWSKKTHKCEDARTKSGS
jgi:hypothetical protein